MSEVVDPFRVLFEANPKPMLVFDRETLELLEINQAACALYGWSRDELLTMSLRDLRRTEEIPELEFAIARERRHTKTTFARHSRHRTKDGRLIEANVELARVTFGGRLATLAVITDLTGTADAERRFRVLVEHSADGICLDQRDGIVYLSPGAERILGVRTGELVGVSSGSLAHPDDLAGVKVPGPGETVVNVTRGAYRDGAWRWIESTTTNLIDDPGIRAYVTNFRDITDRKAAEHATLETQHRLEYLLSATSAITYSARAYGDFASTFISTNVKDILGHEASAFDDPTFFFGHIHPDDRPQVEASLDGLIAEGTHTIRYRFRHADGRYRWMQDSVRLVRDDRGQPAELVGCWLDVTERMTAELALRRSEANFRMLTERLPTATMVHRDGRVIYINPAGATMLGYAIDEIVGRPVLDLIHPEDREDTHIRMERNHRDGGGPSGEIRMLRRDGSTLVVEGDVVQLQFDGAPATVVLARDISERRELFARMAMADRCCRLARSPPASLTRSTIRSRTWSRTSSCSRINCRCCSAIKDRAARASTAPRSRRCLPMRATGQIA
ncbi:MAG: multi-sensor hybrid histidine kinase [Myxococcales bacterium]|nr:multi-sensor hybrid histidine kinase [Myxococcales bacterium]